MSLENQEPTPTPCSDLKKGAVILIEERPCQITQLSIAKAGKHGHSKYHIIAQDLWSHGKKEVSFAHTDLVPVPSMMRKELTLLDINEECNTVSFLNEETEETEDSFELPSGEVGENLLKAYKDDNGDKVIKCEILIVCGKSMIRGFRKE